LTPKSRLRKTERGSSKWGGLKNHLYVAFSKNRWVTTCGGKKKKERTKDAKGLKKRGIAEQNSNKNRVLDQKKDTLKGRG